MQKFLLGLFVLAVAGLAVTRLAYRTPAENTTTTPPSPPPAATPAAPSVVDVIDLALELELAPAKTEPFIPFDE